MTDSGPTRRFLATLRGGRLVIAIAVTFAFLLAMGRLVSSAYIEILWQAEAGFSSAFWTRMLWEWGVRIVAGVGVSLLVFANLRVVSATLGGIQIKRRFGNLEISEQLPRSYVLWAIAGAAALLGLWFGAAVPGNLGLQMLLLVNRVPWGVAEPVLGHDVGFYVFWLPVLLAGVTYALIVTFLVFTLATAGYAATGALRWGRNRVDAQPVARGHLGALVAVFLLLLAVRLWMGRYWLLLDGTSAVRGIFGYADAEARQPAMQTLSVICAAAAGGAFWGIWKNRTAAVVASFGAVILGTMVIGQFFPALVQSFRVEPNELERETPFIEHSLAFTRMGFGLADLDRRSLDYTAEAPVDWGLAARQFSGLPVWNASSLLTTFRAVEARYPYYDFEEVTIDRYTGPEGPEVVAVAVREIDPAGIQDPNWQNRHLRETYVEGRGVVVSRAATRTPEGRPPMLVSGFPEETPNASAIFPAFRLERPEIYFGSRGQEYAVVASALGSGVERTPGLDEPNGIRLSSTFRTALLAWNFGDANLLFAAEVTDDSRFVFRRRVAERVAAIAPFLRYPEAPYPVVADGRVVWILEAFTGTRAFPLSAVHRFGSIRSDVTWARNSVKVTVDATTGFVNFYRVPIEDPLADAYAGAFPGLFRPMAEMPPELREHIRYSKSFIALQSQVLEQYHQETARAFHGQQDVWATPQELAEDTNPVPYRAEYGLYELPGDEEPRFNLTTAFIPRGRQNLTALLSGRTDDSGVPELVLFDVPVADQIPGPRQIEALVEQDPQISQEFSLWRTGGSEVWTGHLHLIPVSGRLLYLEPVFLAAAADAIPELRRFVVSDGVRVAMTEDLSAAIAQLAGLDLPVTVPGTESTTADVARSPDSSAWPQEALDLLEEAESKARAGDWQGYGEALEALRALLRSVSGRGG